VKGHAHITIATAALLGAAVLGSSGCAKWKKQPMALDSVACMYDRAQITYRVDASRLRLPLAVSKVEAQHVSYQESPSSPEPGNSIGTLIVRYPHPLGKPDAALAEVVIDSHPKGVTRPTDIIHEVWTLDIAKNDLDQIVGRLRDTRYFREPAKGETGVHLTASLDKITMDKAWDQVPELNLLMQQVRSRGQLVAYNRPTVGLASTEPPPSKNRLVRWFGKSKTPAQNTTYAQGGAYASPPQAQTIKFDPPQTSLPNPIYAGIGGTPSPALPNAAPAYAPPAYAPPAYVAPTSAAPPVQTVAANQGTLPGVSVSGANAVYGGRSAPRKVVDNISPTMQGAMQQQSQNNMMSGGGGGF
jgi:hypothetical protein